MRTFQCARALWPYEISRTRLVEHLLLIVFYAKLASI